nr:RNA-directed DNA polymerase, eukaryota, reverse transcriptase zinc-binding domain protein [Tanacetum cinerariifolium]
MARRCFDGMYENGHRRHANNKQINIETHDNIFRIDYYIDEDDDHPQIIYEHFMVNLLALIESTRTLPYAFIRQEEYHQLRGFRGRNNLVGTKIGRNALIDYSEDIQSHQDGRLAYDRANLDPPQKLDYFRDPNNCNKLKHNNKYATAMVGLCTIHNPEGVDGGGGGGDGGRDNFIEDLGDLQSFPRLQEDMMWKIFTGLLVPCHQVIDPDIRMSGIQSLGGNWRVIREVFYVHGIPFFRKSNATISDYFIKIQGVWQKTGNDLLIIAIYAPCDLKDRQMLWDYLTYEIGKWKGEVVIMGYFNKVRYKSDRYGSVFNVQGANVFNSFIKNTGLRSFSKVMEDTWREGPCDQSNAMINMMIKLKYLKTKIREWNKKNMLSEKNVKAKYKDELEALKAIINKLDGNVEEKVKWSIEGDENTSFFHGMLNKKQSLLNIRDIMVDGMWIESPNKVELESDVSIEEIKRAVWDCGIDKSPGPDGFTFGCNSSFLALILKIPDANTVKDFRPISLVGSIKLSSSLSISHMFYVDDAIFVGQWYDGNITTLVHVLECFYRSSGLRINMSKSKVMGVLVDSEKVKCIALKLRCLILKTPFSYLGSKVGGSMSRVHTWHDVVDRVNNRLSKWKMKTLSIGGQELNSKKASWVNWKKVLAPKEKGGLGVSSLYALNIGLMLKQMWRFYTQNTSLWVRANKAIHGDDGKVE